MMKFLLSLLLSALLLSSCATEKVNLSPISANFSNNSSRLSADTFENTGNNVEFIKYSDDGKKLYLMKIYEKVLKNICQKNITVYETPEKTTFEKKCEEQN